MGKGADALSANLVYILEFLADVHASGKSYSTINAHRSMLLKTLSTVSKILSTVEGISLGEHPLMVKLLNSFNSGLI